MTLKTLKQKANISLILDDEFLQYCKLNNIEDVEKLAKETFNQGFAILKYGKVPSGIKIEVKKEESPAVIAVPTPSPVTEKVIEVKGLKNSNIYGE